MGAFTAKYPIFTKIVDKIYRAIQRMDKSFYLARLAKKNSKTFLRCSEQIMERAKVYGLKNKADIVCCGHTHLRKEDRTGDVWYYNCGCWTEVPYSYLSVRDGNVQINLF